MPKLGAQNATKKVSLEAVSDFPLTLRPLRAVVQKNRGRLHYFGADPEAALSKYLEERDDLQAGRAPRSKAGGLTITQLVNDFLHHNRERVKTGELSERTWADYDAAEHLVSQSGRDRAVADLRPDDFGEFRAKLAEGRGVVSLNNAIVRTRVILAYAFDNDLIHAPVRFGKKFERVSQKALRKGRRAGGSRMIEADELRKIIEVAGQPLKAMALLALNGGFGASDPAAMPPSAIDLAEGRIDFPRVETEVGRVRPLWPETSAPLREAIDARPEPEDPADAGLAFITREGRHWVRSRGARCRTP